jgi:membrane-associated phospholipid phosphatase
MRVWRNVVTVYKKKKVRSMHGTIVLMPVFLFIHSLDNPYALAFIIGSVALALFYIKQAYAVLFFISVAGTVVSTYLLKVSFAIPRPTTALITTEGYRFPSMHAAITAAVCASFIYATFHSTESNLLRTGVLIAGALVMMLVDYSRVALGVHLPVDVVVGTLLGIAITVFVWMLPA